jgi:D-arabinose 1-dehydrogenase-like Zn-dependent alcohol dehydrogenase
MELAAQIGISSEVEVHPLSSGNEALRRIESGEVAGAAVLIPGSTAGHLI